MIATLFTASCLWKGPNDSEEKIYFSGVSKKKFTNVSLVDSLDSSYATGTAFKLVGTNSDDLGRVYKLSTQDEITINVSSDVTYGVDDYNGYLVFDAAITTTNVSVTIEKYYASVHTSNLISFNKLIDLEKLNERAITSMVSTTDGIYLAGISGKIWFYDGEYVRGPIFILQDDSNDISSSCMVSHKFEHESEDYLYVASDTKPRLFRAKLSTAYNGSEWEQVYPQGELASSSGGILSMVSAYNKLFLGCLDKKVHKYSRAKTVSLSQPTNLITEEVIVKETEVESLSTTTLISNNISDYEPVNFGIRCLSVGKNQVFAGIDKKSEVWSYSEIPISNPTLNENWTTFHFDEVFLNDPAPAQFYSYDNNTLSRNDENLAIARFPNFHNAKGFDDFLVIKGATQTSTGTTAFGSRLFEISEGSDWEQLLAEILPDQDFIDVQAASFEAITSWNNFESLDGYDFVLNDLFMLKDQTSAGTNGIQNGIYVYNGANNDPTLVNINRYVLSGSEKIGFYIQNGYVNLGNRYLLNYTDLLSTGYFNFYKPSYTLESEVINLSKSEVYDSTDLKNEPGLNSAEQILVNSHLGYQGFKIADVYGQYSIEFNTDTLVLSSGNNSVSKSLTTTGLIKNWQFYAVSSGVASADTQSWAIRNFIESLDAETETNYDVFNNSYDKYILKVTPSLTGNPSIDIDNLNLSVDLNTVIKLRIKIKNKSQSLDLGKIRAYWAFNAGGFNKYAETNIHTSDEYIDYTIKPIWQGNIGKLSIEFVGLPENNQRPEIICIDLIQILSDENVFDINNSLSKMRVIVEDRDIKIYLGLQNDPFLEKKNFIKLDTYNPKYIDSESNSWDHDHPFIQFGKLRNDASDSLVGFSKISFVIGQKYAPVDNKIIDFNLSAVLPSTGGIRLFTYHDGTLYCATDGYVSDKISDNPNDRQSKLFYYKSDAESWFNEEVSFERKKIFDSSGNYDLLGIVRPLTSISYKGNLFLSGHYGSIK